MKAHEIERHARKIEADTAEMDAAHEAGEYDTANMIWDAIKFRKKMLAKHGVVIV